ncbi:MULTISPECIES: glutathione peroxidase [unclassified Aeromicrobium]|uniref:glutathione peroxidase n=1 Tax=unclassified Aeromicrobium TaxID=2633570 RepID=UPI0006F6F88B|nr:MULTISPECIES: glutathione peroxidase [unclassified Aeromicrobium]KQO38664.1 glutathione peroxidase [Aeromicrobium sp. Leaf245]KQP25430.1 glutathione peroxidase [Aeromicrobium sp. Leaf272]KQP80000.1 glutathione peroxidase [Aeromicrobium sp. Leaf289]KQP81914.1 glutathione peroxidase [Aeromicrobium sp. Leaf291]MCR4514771.1 glutathione peroxidase [Aeromicrobium sp. 50.2.37]
MTTAYDFTANAIDGTPRELADYRGKVLLVVNTATQCGFTPQLAGLEELYASYADRGLVVLGFPCDQFGGQNPDSDDDTAAFCERNYGVSFPMFSQVEVNGDDAHPLYQWLRSEKSGFAGNKIKWNFTKFLIDTEGNVVKRYGSTTKPEKIASDIEALLAS